MPEILGSTQRHARSENVHWFQRRDFSDVLWSRSGPCRAPCREDLHTERHPGSSKFSKSPEF